MPVTTREIDRSLACLAPPFLAENWDNVGLLIGDATQPVQTVLVALDATARVLDQAAAHGAELLVTHHPLIFSGLKRIVEDGGTVSLITRLLREHRGLIAAHTNLDSAPAGLNTHVAALLGLRDTRPLIPSEARPLLKLVVYVPQSHADAVRDAICAAGAGAIGNYSDCTFGTFGTGTFRPGAGAHPYIGSTGALERVEEIRLETVVPQSVLRPVLDALFAHHPYEEVAYDLLPMENAWPGAGLGRIGQLEAPVTAGEFLHLVREVLHSDRLSFIGDRSRRIRTVALCTGAGSEFMEQAFRQHADCYLTGEVKHHHALLAQQRGLAVIDAGHFATERPAVSLMATYLQRAFPDLRVIQAEEEDPMQRGISS